jgi:hypothetical protein
MWLPQWCCRACAYACTGASNTIPKENSCPTRPRFDPRPSRIESRARGSNRGLADRIEGSRIESRARGLNRGRVARVILWYGVESSRACVCACAAAPRWQPHGGNHIAWESRLTNVIMSWGSHRGDHVVGLKSGESRCVKHVVRTTRWQPYGGNHTVATTRWQPHGGNHMVVITCVGIKTHDVTTSWESHRGDPSRGIKVVGITLCETRRENHMAATILWQPHGGNHMVVITCVVITRVGNQELTSHDVITSWESHRVGTHIVGIKSWE